MLHSASPVPTAGPVVGQVQDLLPPWVTQPGAVPRGKGCHSSSSFSAMVPVPVSPQPVTSGLTSALFIHSVPCRAMEVLALPQPFLEVQVLPVPMLVQEVSAGDAVSVALCDPLCPQELERPVSPSGCGWRQGGDQFLPSLFGAQLLPCLWGSHGAEGVNLPQG